MSSKVILLKYLPRIHDQSAVDAAQRCYTNYSCCDKTAIIVERDSSGFISVQGYSPVHQSEKHKAWSIFQKAIKQLLGIHKDTAICMRFADPPNETVGSISTLFHQSNHLIDLIVQPIHCRITASPTQIVTNLSRPREAMTASMGGKDPYCAFREKYYDSKSRSSLVREKCNFAEMNRLISQLAEVSICLKHTQQECELIEERCSKKVAENLSSTSTAAVAESEVLSRSYEGSDGAKAIKHCTSASSSYSCDSGKGSMTDADALEGVVKEEEEEDSGKGSMTDADALEGVVKEEEEKEGCDGISQPQQIEDKEVERLLQIAQSLTQQIRQQQLRKAPTPESSPLLLHHLHLPATLTPPLPGAPPLPVPGTSSPHVHGTPSSLPDSPSGVVVRSSFRHEGAYVMWDPVSIDGCGVNCGRTVLGYQIYLDKQLQCKVGGALSSQVELTGMEDGCEYVVQVSTECERHSSLLTVPLVYRHEETNRPHPPLEVARQPDETPATLPPLTTQPNPSQHHQTTPTTTAAAAAAPEGIEAATSKLPPQHVHVDDCKVAKVHTWLKNKDYSDLDQSQPLRLVDDHAHHSKGHAPLRVHFADEEFCVCGDDEKSIGSSHTSGIVTDFPMSPKLLPHCSCQQCSSGFMEFTDSPGGPCSSHSHDDTSQQGGTRAESASNSTLAGGRAHDVHSSSEEDIDTTIDEPPPLLDDPGYLGSPVRSGRAARRAGTDHGCSGTARSVAENCKTCRRTGDGELQRHQKSVAAVVAKGLVFYKRQRKLPEAPTNVCASLCGRKGETLAVSWNPAKRDGNGCSNGCHVLGYRVYVNGRCWLSVDGALTAKTALSCPIPSPSSVLVHIRTRSMSAESPPSNTATLFKRKAAHVHKYERVDHIHSSLETYV